MRRRMSAYDRIVLASRGGRIIVATQTINGSRVMVQKPESVCCLRW